MKPSPLRTYTCTDYRDEMRLLALKRRLAGDELGEEERRALAAEVERIERAMAMD
ncbi:MAG: hypothetical protein ACYDA8_05395 [Deferrisomatales bacterium]